MELSLRDTHFIISKLYLNCSFKCQLKRKKEQRPEAALLWGSEGHVSPHPHRCGHPTDTWHFLTCSLPPRRVNLSSASSLIAPSPSWWWNYLHRILAGKKDAIKKPLSIQRNSSALVTTVLCKPPIHWSYLVDRQPQKGEVIARVLWSKALLRERERPIVSTQTEEGRWNSNRLPRGPRWSVGNISGGESTSFLRVFVVWEKERVLRDTVQTPAMPLIRSVTGSRWQPLSWEWRTLRILPIKPHPLTWAKYMVRENHCNLPADT